MGVLDFELVDSERKGVLLASAEEPRRLLVRVWYPAENIDGIKPRPYYTKEERGTTAGWLGGALGMPFIFKYMAYAKTNSYENAPLLAGAASLPTIIYSHGYMSFAGQNTVLMEELASYGYVVYSVQHTYESAATVFPNGDIVKPDSNILNEIIEDATSEDIAQSTKDAFGGETFDIRRAGQVRMREKAIAKGGRIVTRSAPIWIADRIFVHDALEKGEAPAAVADIVASSNLQHTGELGMSFGGSTTGGVCLVDRRCVAAANLDGGNVHVPIDVNMPAPFMMFYSDYQKIAAQASGDKSITGHGFNDFFYERHETAGLRKDVYRLKVNGAAHLGVSDFTWFLRRPLRDRLFGTVDDRDMLSIQNDFVLGFFDKHLKHIKSDFPDAQFAKHKKWVVRDGLSDLRKWWLELHPEDETVQVVLETSLGDIEIALYPKRAPAAVGNFLTHVEAKYFDGATFYPANETAVDQNGDIAQSGLTGLFITKSADELALYDGLSPPKAPETTVQTGIPNERGVLSYVRGAPGRAEASFFINTHGEINSDTTEPLSGLEYVTFGRVLRGVRILGSMRQSRAGGPTDADNLKSQFPIEPVKIKRAYRVDKSRRGS